MLVVGRAYWAHSLRMKNRLHARGSRPTAEQDDARFFEPVGSGAPSPPHGWFATTHWSVLLEVNQEDSARRTAALERLCQAYWQPVYALIRHKGCEIHDAEDLTQSFFAYLLSRNTLRGLDPRKGKFRSFLVVVLRRFLANEAKRSCAAKRGGGRTPLPLEPEAAEVRLLAAAAPGLTPEQLFDRHWALAVLDRSLAGLQHELEQQGERARFEQLKVFLSSDGGSEDYAKAGVPLGLTAAAVKVAVHRLRHRYGELLRQEIARTVESPFEVEAEMHYLLDLLAG